MSKKAESNFVIDVDIIIDAYNKKNPKKEMTRKTLADAIGKTPQLFSDWKNKKSPSIVAILMELKEIGGINIDEFIVSKQ